MKKYDPCIYHSVEVLATTNLHFLVPFLLETERVTKIQNQEKRNEGTITWKLCTIKQRILLMGLYQSELFSGDVFRDIRRYKSYQVDTRYLKYRSDLRNFSIFLRICVGNSMICSDISKLLYVISRAVRRVKFETILKYHEWYLC